MSNQVFARPLFAALVSAGAFWLTSELQGSVGAEVDVGVSTPYLPAGVRLIAVTVFGLAGAVGLFLGALMYAPEVFPVAGIEGWLAVALISAGVPMLTLYAVRRAFCIGEQLLELSYRALLLLMALQAVVSPLAHQLLFWVTDMAPASAYNLLAMIVGDFVGCTLVVLALALAWGWWRPRI